MKVYLYEGSFKLVEKSGVGQAVLHQKTMLQGAGAQITSHMESDIAFVHINTIFPDSFFTALVAKIRRKRVIYYGHSTMEDFRNSFKGSNFFAPLFRRWIKLCYGLGDVIITPTAYSRQLLRRYGIKKPIYVLSNGVDTDFFSPNASRRDAFRRKYHLRDDEKAVLSVGHYIERKGILDFIELAKSMPEVRFFWFGYTNLSLVPKKIQQAITKAPDNLVFPGYVDREEMRNAYCGCDLFCFMSYEETEGIVVLEALSCRIPTIVRDIPVYRDWLTDGSNVYKADHKERFTFLVQSILFGNAKDLTQDGRNVARERSIPATGEALLSIYRLMTDKEKIIVKDVMREPVH